VPTPPFPLARFQTFGSYPLLRGARLDLRRVNAALSEAVTSDQRAFLPLARKLAARAKPIPGGFVGDYVTELDRGLVSASTSVVSILLPRTREVLPARGLNDSWLGITLEVPSGRRVTFADLFRDSAAARRLLRARARKESRGGGCKSTNLAAPTVFALLPNGLVVGVPSQGGCYRFTLRIPYRDLRSNLSRLGKRLTSSARWPSYRPDWKNLTYCRRPDLSGAELSATGEVACATARKVEATAFSRCSSKRRCTVASFTCLGGWPGHHGTFEATNHGVCTRGRRRIQMDEG
jgi:hypothetical protein